MTTRWKYWLSLAATAIVLPSVVAVSSLALADWSEMRHWTPDPLEGVLLTIDHGDRLHYVGHFMLGRALDLCDCANRAAAEQYHRATWHARTPRQLALVTSDRPQGTGEWLADGAGIVISGARWGQRGSSWLVTRLSRAVG